MVLYNIIILHGSPVFSCAVHAPVCSCSHDTNRWNNSCIIMMLKIGFTLSSKASLWSVPLEKMPSSREFGRWGGEVTDGFSRRTLATAEQLRAYLGHVYLYMYSFVHKFTSARKYNTIIFTVGKKRFVFRLHDSFGQPHTHTQNQMLQTTHTHTQRLQTHRHHTHTHKGPPL